MIMFSQHHWQTATTTKYQMARNPGSSEGGDHERNIKTAITGQCRMNQGARRPHFSLLKQPGRKSSFSLSCSRGQIETAQRDSQWVVLTCR